MYLFLQRLYEKKMSLICLTQLCLDYLADVCNLIHYCAPNKVLQRKKMYKL